MRFTISFTMALALLFMPASDPYASLSPDQKTLLKPQIERWIHDQVKHDWADMWELQDQTPELKNELLLGRKDAPDLDRNQYIQAMKETIGIGYPMIEAFTLRAVEVKNDGRVLWISGCAKEQREEWQKTGIMYVRAKIINGKALFDLPPVGDEPCEL